MNLGKPFNLFRNIPNPFQGSTKIVLELNRSTDAKLQIVDIMGRVVKVLSDGHTSTGLHEIEWHAEIGSGLYFCELITPETKSVIKLMLY